MVGILGEGSTRTRSGPVRAIRAGACVGRKRAGSRRHALLTGSFAGL
ncbi:sperm protamine P1 family protein [Burkholderia ubonensis]|uniref:Sperm protamine P1 family protein n=1 Tax=Burkholderia ubonensis TaxID=101571 RepID=A0AB74DAC2_9BURK|nr:sperm protamine P1 family protein [Burkholderia ubonensis]RQP43979.1 sperm protamine P1 family protein [Burkholderia ubonensis]RQP47036.1 sperm protamine P1 family protein [Burkholderia ubonensis]RQP60306.1 sperm protamine P1 family protein [Burkholderia ubonensis]RQP64820.1 sperm protamine P1 family protein [Burkholderia ubonensis]